MKVVFYIEGDSIKNVDYDSKFQGIINRAFDLLEVDMPQCPVKGQRVELAKDGIVLTGDVEYVTISYYAPGNGIYKEELDGTVEYLVRLGNMELLDWDDDRYEKSLFKELRHS